MKKYVLLNLCLIFLAVTLHAADGVTQDIDKICHFTFPFAPQTSEVGGMRNYLCPTDSCSYLVQIKPLVKAGIVRDTATLRAFYSGIVKGILRGAHGSLIGHKKVDADGLVAEELEYIKGDKDHQPLSICSRILLLDGRVIVYTFSAPYSRFSALRHSQDQFFSSFQTDKEAAKSQLITSADSLPTAVAEDTFLQPVTDTMAAHPHPAVIHTELVRSNTLHFIVSFALCILLLAAILYLLVRWKKKRGGN